MDSSTFAILGRTRRVEAVFVGMVAALLAEVLVPFQNAKRHAAQRMHSSVAKILRLQRCPDTAT